MKISTILMPIAISAVAADWSDLWSDLKTDAQAMRDHLIQNAENQLAQFEENFANQKNIYSEKYLNAKQNLENQINIAKQHAHEKLDNLEDLVGNAGESLKNNLNNLSDKWNSRNWDQVLQDISKINWQEKGCEFLCHFENSVERKKGVKSVEFNEIQHEIELAGCSDFC